MRGAESLGKPLTHGGRVLRFAGKTGDHTHSNRSLRGKPFRSEKGFASMKRGMVSFAARFPCHIAPCAVSPQSHGARAKMARAWRGPKVEKRVSKSYEYMQKCRYGQNVRPGLHFYACFRGRTRGRANAYRTTKGEEPGGVSKRVVREGGPPSKNRRGSPSRAACLINGLHDLYKVYAFFRMNILNFSLPYL